MNAPGLPGGYFRFLLPTRGSHSRLPRLAGGEAAAGEAGEEGTRWAAWCSEKREPPRGEPVASNSQNRNLRPAINGWLVGMRKLFREHCYGATSWSSSNALPSLVVWPRYAPDHFITHLIQKPQPRELIAELPLEVLGVVVLGVEVSDRKSTRLNSSH